MWTGHTGREKRRETRKVKVKNMATGEEVEAELAPEAIINIIK